MATRTFGTDARGKMASKGIALPDGSYPIPDKDALRRAVQSFGRAKEADRAKVKAHIIKRAKALGAYDSLPDDWKSEVKATSLLSLREALGLSNDELELAVASNSTDAVRRAYSAQARAARAAHAANSSNHSNGSIYPSCPDCPPDGYVQDVLTDNSVIVSDESDGVLLKYPFTMAQDGSVTFGTPKRVRIEYVEVAVETDPEDQLPAPPALAQAPASLSNLLALNGGQRV